MLRSLYQHFFGGTTTETGQSHATHHHKPLVSHGTEGDEPNEHRHLPAVHKRPTNPLTSHGTKAKEEQKPSKPPLSREEQARGAKIRESGSADLADHLRTGVKEFPDKSKKHSEEYETYLKQLAEMIFIIQVHLPDGGSKQLHRSKIRTAYGDGWGKSAEELLDGAVDMYMTEQPKGKNREEVMEMD